MTWDMYGAKGKKKKTKNTQRIKLYLKRKNKMKEKYSTWDLYKLLENMKKQFEVVFRTRGATKR